MKARVTSLIIILLLLAACEEIPEETSSDDRIHRVSLELEQISQEPLYPGAIVDYNYTLINIGREDLFDVALETRLRKQSTGEIIKTQAELIEMALVVFKEGGMPLPKDLKKGQYELTMVATWDDGSDSSSFTFTVDVEETEEPVEETKTEKEPTFVQETTEEKKGTTEEKKETEEPEITGTESESKTANVIIQDYQYHPQELNITVGTTVVWFNNDSVPHSASGAGFDSGPITKGDTYSHTFDKPVIKIYSSTYTEGPYGKIIITE